MTDGFLYTKPFDLNGKILLIFDDMNNEALVQKINDEQILKRLFQFSKKTRSAKDMTEDCHAPFENSNYL